MKDNVKFYTTALLFIVTAVLLVVSFRNPGQGITQTSSAVQIPSVITIALDTFLFGVLTVGFAWILSKIGLDLTAFSTPLAASLSTFLIGLFQNWINIQPIQYDPIIQLLINVIVVVVGGTGTLFLIAKGQGRSTLI